MRDEFHGEEFGYGIVADDAAEPVGSGIPEGLDKGIGAGFEFSENFGTDLDNWWGRCRRSKSTALVFEDVRNGVGSYGASDLRVRSLSGRLVFAPG
ncbi:hypothetical protein [Nocardia testacea]|uniref:hypothetical protein n=1 Tax=Nocardia testacea TaxID=248551 RepID=UPI003A895CD7